MTDLPAHEQRKESNNNHGADAPWTTKDKKESAHALAARGFRVFPLSPNSKIPPKGLPWKEAATSDELQVEEWWLENPDYNIGVATGGGLLVVDADVKKGAPGLASADALVARGLSPEMTVETPSGGRHLYARVNEPYGNRVGTLSGFPGVDIRCEAGYVVGPGSILDGKPYAVRADHSRPSVAAPDWFLDLLNTKPRDKLPNAPLASCELDQPRNVGKAKQYLATNAPQAIEGSGGDAATFRTAARLRDFALSERTALELLAEHWNETKASPPWPIDELAVKVHNAFSYAQKPAGNATAAADFEPDDTIDVGSQPVRTSQQPTPETAKTASGKSAPALFRATPFVLRDPRTLPRREWLYGEYLARKYLTVTVAPGGVGKSSLTIAEAVCLAIGRPQLGVPMPKGALKVWLWNLEDPRDEIERRIAAVADAFDVRPDELSGQLFVDSGREQSLTLAAVGAHGVEIDEQTVDRLVGQLLENEIDVLVIDPFVSSHRVSENDNPMIDRVAKTLGVIADRANVAVSLVHHTRKPTLGVETTADSARGGSAIVDAARVVRVLNRMSKSEATKAGVTEPRMYFSVNSDKQNMAPPKAKIWYRIHGVELPNGDNVGVAMPWAWPEGFDESFDEGTDDTFETVRSALGARTFRHDPQAREWIGRAIGGVLGLDPKVLSDKKQLERLLRGWRQSGRIRDFNGKIHNGQEKRLSELVSVDVPS